MGRAGEIIAALAQPTPRSLNSIPAVSPSATYVIDGDILTFTLMTEPGFWYQAEFSNDLENWEPLSDEILAGGGTLIFSDTVLADRRFYRFRRLP
jgi:hypothetical protein